MSAAARGPFPPREGRPAPLPVVSRLAGQIAGSAGAHPRAVDRRCKPARRLRRAKAVALRMKRERQPDFGVANHRVDAPLFEAALACAYGAIQA